MRRLWDLLDDALPLFGIAALFVVAFLIIWWDASDGIVGGIGIFVFSAAACSFLGLLYLVMEEFFPREPRIYRRGGESDEEWERRRDQTKQPILIRIGRVSLFLLIVAIYIVGLSAAFFIS